MSNTQISYSSNQGPANPLLSQSDVIAEIATQLTGITVDTVEEWKVAITYTAGQVAFDGGVVYITPAGIASGGLKPSLNTGNWNKLGDTHWMQKYDDLEQYIVGDVVYFNHATLGRNFFELQSAAAIGISPDDDISKWTFAEKNTDLKIYNELMIYKVGEFVFYGLGTSAQNAVYKVLVLTVAGQDPVDTPASWEIQKGFTAFPDGTLQLESPDTTNIATMVNPDSADPTTTITLPDESGVLVNETTKAIFKSPDTTKTATVVNSNSAATPTTITLPLATGTLATLDDLNIGLGLTLALAED